MPHLPRFVPGAAVPIPAPVGYQVVHRETGDPYGDRMTFEVLTGERALRDVLDAEADSPGAFRLVAIYPGDVECPEMVD